MMKSLTSWLRHPSKSSDQIKNGIEKGRCSENAGWEMHWFVCLRQYPYDWERKTECIETAFMDIKRQVRISIIRISRRNHTFAMVKNKHMCCLKKRPELIALWIKCLKIIKHRLIVKTSSDTNDRTEAPKYLLHGTSPPPFVTIRYKALSFPCQFGSSEVSLCLSSVRLSSVRPSSAQLNVACWSWYD